MEAIDENNIIMCTHTSVYKYNINTGEYTQLLTFSEELSSSYTDGIKLKNNIYITSDQECYIYSILDNTFTKIEDMPVNCGTGFLENINDDIYIIGGHVEARYYSGLNYLFITNLSLLLKETSNLTLVRKNNIYNFSDINETSRYIETVIKYNENGEKEEIEAYTTDGQSWIKLN